MLACCKTDGSEDGPGGTSAAEFQGGFDHLEKEAAALKAEMAPPTEGSDSKASTSSKGVWQAHISTRKAVLDSEYDLKYTTSACSEHSLVWAFLFAVVAATVALGVRRAMADHAL